MVYDWKKSKHQSSHQKELEVVRSARRGVTGSRQCPQVPSTTTLVPPLQSWCILGCSSRCEIYSVLSDDHSILKLSLLPEMSKRVRTPHCLQKGSMEMGKPTAQLCWCRRALQLQKAGNDAGCACPAIWRGSERNGLAPLFIFSLGWLETPVTSAKHILCTEKVLRWVGFGDLWLEISRYSQQDVSTTVNKKSNNWWKLLYQVQCAGEVLINSFPLPVSSTRTGRVPTPRNRAQHTPTGPSALGSHHSHPFPWALTPGQVRQPETRQRRTAIGGVTHTFSQSPSGWAPVPTCSHTHLHYLLAFPPHFPTPRAVLLETPK